MFVDASALCSLLTNEDDAQSLLERMRRHRRRMTSPLAVWETVVAVERILDLPLGEVRESVDRYLTLMGIQVVGVPPDVASLAIDAFERYGKRRHRANLNFGDCFSYACARFHGVPLLYKGDNFPLTDIEAA